MPFHIRRLPAKVMTIVDEKSIPQNHVLFNPSYAHPIIYLRGIEHFTTKEINYALLFNSVTKESTKVESPAAFLAPTVNLFQGIEDLRICWAPDPVRKDDGARRLWFSGTTTHASARMTNELIVGYFAHDLRTVEHLSAVDIGSLPVKNVCPFVWKNKLHLLDTFKQDIFEVVIERDEGGAIALSAVRVRKLVPAGGVPKEGVRGSTSPVHLHGNTWGCVVHDIIFNDNTKLVTRLSYYHHWMEFDIETGAVTFLSTPFWIAHWGIEYVSGLHYDAATGEVTLYVGEADRSCVMAKTTLHDLRCGK
jgi:hypothetical protein